ncbi:MAG: hypothetical protein ACOYKM_14160 [Caulobacterales bacterium]|jgi:hypothetical protein
MRGYWMVAALAALTLAACSEQGSIGAPPTAEQQARRAAEIEAQAANGYTLEVFESEGDHVYVVSHPQTGRQTAARAHAGVANLMDADEARTLLGERQSAMAVPSQEVLNFSVPGFAFAVKADGSESENAQIALQIAGQSVNINAQGPDGAGSAVVRITGADADSAREFITKADEIDPGVQQQMLDALQL